MGGWKTKVFGDNRFNFYGWIFTGLLVFGVSIWFMVKAFDAGAGHSPVCLLLIGIFFLLAGHFGLALQTYCARAAKSIEDQNANKPTTSS